jgi:hypothetical protein
VHKRKKLFEQAMDRGMWQLVKPLIEMKDRTGIRHRDTALLEAIEERQWDVVDYCQVFDADIDMQDEHGETPLNREAKTREWKAVEELVVREADPNLLDNDGHSVMNEAIQHEQWNTVNLLIVYQANIHTPAPIRFDHSHLTPLQLLIDKRQGELIHTTLMWCPDQAQGVNNNGETTLHAIVMDKRPELLYRQVVRGVNPLSTTTGGCSVLLYAVQNPRCLQAMVAECIRLGFSTHQPALTQQPRPDIVQWLKEFLSFYVHTITSPLLLAVARGLHVVAQMLYESGSCSHPELLHLYDQLLMISNSDGRILLDLTNQSVERWKVRNLAERRQRLKELTTNIETFLPYLKEMVHTPRTLVSICRLVISRCLTVRRRRERAVRQLTLPQVSNG